MPINQTKENMQYIPTAQLAPHPKNPRLVMREDVIESIRAGLKDGFLPCYALQVWPQGDHFLVLSGHHRLEAAKREGITELPCFVREELDEEDAYMVLATANAQGELSPLEIGCHAYGLPHGTAKEYATAIGKSAAFVSQVKSGFEVAKLSQLNFEQLQDKTQHLAAIHKLPESGWQAAVDYMLAQNLSAKETAERVKQSEAATDARAIALFTGKTSARELARIDETRERVTASLEYDETRQEWIDWNAENDPLDIKQLQAKRIEIETKEADRREAEREPEPELEAKPQPNLIMADPPWKYDFAETDNRQIENHYPTGTVPEIAKYMRGEMLKNDVASDAVLFLWATVAKLTEAFELLDEIGFQYKTSAVWDKEKIGMGYWFRGQHELLLVATRGQFSPPEQENRRSSVFREVRGKHSAKPVCVYEWIESAFPEAVKMEIFQRTQRTGWIGVGNESP